MHLQRGPLPRVYQTVQNPEPTSALEAILSLLVVSFDGSSPVYVTVLRCVGAEQR